MWILADWTTSEDGCVVVAAIWCGCWTEVVCEATSLVGVPGLLYPSTSLGTGLVDYSCVYGTVAWRDSLGAGVNS